MNTNEEEIGPHFPQNRSTAPSKMRRGGKHCPLCLRPLAKNARRTRLMRNCLSCGAFISPGKRCAKCFSQSIWENKTEAACQSCGLHGDKTHVIAKAPTEKI